MHDTTHDSYDFDLYRVLIQEYRDSIAEWLSNFRVLLSFNALFTPATIALLIYVLKGDLDTNIMKYGCYFLILLSFIGIMATTTFMFVIIRIKKIIKLRLEQIRRIESLLIPYISIVPFWEGFMAIGNIIDNSTLEKLEGHYKKPEQIKNNFLHGIFAYSVISISFILAYLTIIYTSVNIIVEST